MGATEIAFDEQDVWRLARHVRLTAIHLNEHGRNSLYECGCCGQSVFAFRNNGSEIQHSRDCLYLIAKDVLAGAPPELGGS